MKMNGLRRFSGRTLMAAFIGALGVIAAPRENVLADNIAYSETIRDTDVVAAGVGGMRNSSSAAINLTGLSGTVNKAYLYWHGPMNVNDPMANAAIRVNNRNVTGVSLGLSDDNCWGFLNSAAYRADVTSLVRMERNGTYTLSNFLKQGTNINANGASLIVFYNDTNPANNRDVVLFEGNDSNAPNPYDDLGWNVTLPGINYFPTNVTNVLVQLHVSDGQSWDDDDVKVNGTIIQPRGPGFQGTTVSSNNNGPENNGALWDIKTWDITRLLTFAATNDLEILHGYIGHADGSPKGDCVSLIVALINLPAGSAPPPPPPSNLPPVVTGTPSITVYTPGPITVPALATDENGDPLTYTIAINGTTVQTGAIPGATPVTSGTMSVTNSFGLGQHTVVFTANDGKATGSFTTIVSVIDTNPPVLHLPPNITVGTDPGKSNAVVTYVVTATDDWDPEPVVISLPPSGGTYQIGTTTVTVTAVDRSGNRTQGTFTITVTDALPPAIACPPDILRATDPGTNNAVVRYTIPASDNLPGMTLSCAPPSGSVFPLGITAVVCTARDAAGNTATCTFTVTIVDTEPPVITVPTNMVQVAATGECSAVVNYTVTVTDNVPGATVACVPPSGSVFPLGTTPVVCTAMDTSNNKSTNSFTVTIVDTQKPVLNLPANITVGTDPGKTTAAVTFTVTATDNCSTPTVSTRPGPGSFPLGTTTVTATATDTAGNTATGTFTVTVVDTEPPVITTPTNMILVADLGQCSAVVNFTVTVKDNVPGATVVCTPPSGSVFPKGTTTVVCVATDMAGNRVTNTFLVTIVDTQAPVLTLPPNISIPIPAGQSNTVVTFNVTATDNCSVPTVVSTPPSGSVFPIGVTVVTNVATDADGNRTTGTFTVTIVGRPNEGGDNIPPVVTVPTNMVVTTDLNQCSAVVNYTVTVTDNLPGATVTCNPPSGSVFPRGVTTVLCVGTDVAGNQGSASFTVTVVDMQKPVLNLPANISVVIPVGQTSTPVSFNVTATDNCSVPTVVSTPPSGSSFPVGVTTVTNIATDAAGNTTVGTFTVTVRNQDGGDNVPPVITVPTNMVVGTDINQCSAVVNYTVTVTDNRPGATVVCNPASGSTFPKGVTTVVCVATDVAGNQANASFTVTVVDTQKPTLNLPMNITVTIPTNQNSAVVTYNVTATDNCSVPTVISTPPSGSTFPVGVTTVTNIATDGAGNTTVGTFTVTVRRDPGGDTEPPVIVSVTPSKPCLWPPNHKMVPITVTVKATDNSGKKVTARIVSVTSNEPENDLGDGNTEKDWSITGALKVNLRAERSGLLTDRIYTITVEVKDAAGNISYGTTSVCVSHDQGNPKNATATKKR